MPKGESLFLFIFFVKYTHSQRTRDFFFFGNGVPLQKDECW